MLVGESEKEGKACYRADHLAPREFPSGEAVSGKPSLISPHPRRRCLQLGSSGEENPSESCLVRCNRLVDRQQKPGQRTFMKRKENLSFDDSRE